MPTLYPKSIVVNEDSIARLTDTLKVAYSDILKEINSATDFGVANRKAILAQIESVLTDAGQNMQDFLEEELPAYYKDGANLAVKQLKNVDAPIDVKSGFNVIHKDAIAALVDDASRAFGESLTGVARSANLVLGKSVRDAITQKIASGKLSGAALREVRQNVKGILQEQGLSALVDKGGREWSLDRYSEMLIRTKAVEARNRGLANRIAENGYDLVQVSSHGADDVCADWEGAILSLNGDTAGYDTVDDAEAAGLFHPNCKHAINALVPSLSNKTNAYDPNEDTLSPEEAGLEGY